MTNHYSTASDAAESKYAKLLRGKSVSILGGDDEIDWDRVNATEIVVRINSHFRRQGGRIDALWWSCASDLGGLDPSDFENAGQESLIFVWLNKTHKLFGPNGGTFAADSTLVRDYDSLSFAEYWHAPAVAFDVFAVLRAAVPENYWARRIAERWNFYPLTGVLAVAYTITRTEAASVYLDGFSFYQGKTGALPAKAGRHAVAPNVDCFRDLAREYPERVEFSEKLKKIITF